MRILGIDPGLRLTGFGCLEPAPRSGRSDAKVIDAGVLRLDADAPVADRLVELDRDFRELLDRLKPDVLAIEMLYSHYKHPATAIVMGHGRGVIILAAKQRSVTLVELRPTEIKKSLTGHGHATKAQMQDSIAVALALEVRPEPPDVADALAMALCVLRRGI